SVSFIYSNVTVCLSRGLLHVRGPGSRNFCFVKADPGEQPPYGLVEGDDDSIRNGYDHRRIPHDHPSQLGLGHRPRPDVVGEYRDESKVNYIDGIGEPAAELAQLADCTGGGHARPEGHDEWKCDRDCEQII